jgi:diguanylate cyclase (GGDEF)-like protein
LVDGVETRHQIDLPIRRGERLYGVLSVESPDRPFEREDETVLQTLADHLSVLWANQELRQRIERSAMQDPLTGLWNRRYLVTRLGEEEARMVRTGESMAVGLIDLTDFKKVNDRYGHLVGDMVLQELGRLLRGALRACDVIVRYGGDEFLLLMPRTERAGAEATLRRFAERLPSMDVPGCPMRVSFDWGVAVCPEDGRNFEALLGVADERMYASKERKKREENLPDACPRDGDPGGASATEAMKEERS